MVTTRVDRTRYVIGDPSDHVGFLNCERVSERAHIHGWSVEPHCHEGLTQLFVFGEGEVEARIDYESHSITGPAVVWLPSLCSHAFDYQVGIEGWVITVPSTDVARLANEGPARARWMGRPQLLTGPAHRSDLAQALALARGVEGEHRRNREDRNGALEAWFRLLVILLGRALSEEARPNRDVPSRKQQLAARFNEWLEATDLPDRSVSAAATALSVTPTHLSRSLKEITGRTAGEIMADQTLLASKRRLAFTDQSIAELAEELGFSSPSYFSRFFSGRTGEAPRSFRRRARHATLPART